MKYISTFCLIILLFLQTSGMHYTYLPTGKNVRINDTLIQALNREAPKLLTKHKVPAVGVAIVENGKIKDKAIYGWQEPDLLASDKTLFNVASLTKPVTFETILRIIATGKISLDEPMWPYWVDPDIKNDTLHKLLTPRICLSHQTGFGNWRNESPDSLLEFKFKPGTAFGYSGEGYNYVARFVEKKLGKTFEELAQEYIFDPIGMKNTSYSWRNWMKGRIAIPANNTGKYGLPENQPTGNWDAANNLSTTIEDYGLFLASVIKGEMLTKELIEERLKIYSSTTYKFECNLSPASLCPTSCGMTLSWERFNFSSNTLMMHLGGNLRPDGAGEAAVVYYYPQQNRGVVILTSGRNGDAVFSDLIDIVDANWPLRALFRAKK